ncbi:hypothetical protein FACS1894216_02400 [Synergistales bacterium]|nr:hypothetical protein FACS1894216_02400 [Synergistales bacterium]
MIDSIFARQCGLMAKIITRLHEDALTPEEKRALEAVISQMPTKKDYALSEQLAAVIQMLMDYENGLSMLLGRVAPPDSAQIQDMINSFNPPGELGVRVDGGQSTPLAERLIYTEETFNSVIARCGGWGHINKELNNWIKVRPNEWAIIRDHVRWVRIQSSRLSGSMLEKIARIHSCSTDTVSRLVSRFPRDIAYSITRSPADGVLTLRSTEERAI